MALNEETLTALLPRYKERMMNFAPTQQWEESVVIYFLINGLRIKNSQFNDKIKEYMGSGENSEKVNPLIRPRLRLVKTSEAEEQKEGEGSPEDGLRGQFTVCGGEVSPDKPDGGQVKGGARGLSRVDDQKDEPDESDGDDGA